MTRLIWIVPIVVLLYGQSATAQTQRTGYVNTERILEQMPEYRGIEERLTMLGTQWREELEGMEQELAQFEQEFEERELLYDEEMRLEQQERMDQLEREMEAYLHQRFGPDGDYFEQQQRLLEPLQQQIYQAVRRVATENGYDFVMDRAGEPRLLFAREEWDLTEEVLQVLGIGTGRESELRN